MCAQFVCQHETTNEADPLLIVSYYFNDKLHLKKKKKQDYCIEQILCVLNSRGYLQRHLDDLINVMSKLSINTQINTKTLQSKDGLDLKLHSHVCLCKCYILGFHIQNPRVHALLDMFLSPFSDSTCKPSDH